MRLSARGQVGSQVIDASNTVTTLTGKLLQAAYQTRVSTWIETEGDSGQLRIIMTVTDMAGNPIEVFNTFTPSTIAEGGSIRADLMNYDGAGLFQLEIIDENGTPGNESTYAVEFYNTDHNDRAT